MAAACATEIFSSIDADVSTISTIEIGRASWVKRLSSWRVAASESAQGGGGGGGGEGGGGAEGPAEPAGRPRRELRDAAGHGSTSERRGTTTRVPGRASSTCSLRVLSRGSVA